MNRKEFYESLSADVKEKIKACKSEQEMLKVLEDEKIELSPDLLDSVAGGQYVPGGPCYDFECDKCHDNDACFCD